MVLDEISPNMYKLEIALPNGGAQNTNCYIIKGSQRNLIVDPGHDHEECLAVMIEALDQLGIDLSRTDYFITHGHGDHFGLVKRLVCDDAVVYAASPDAHVIGGTESSPMLKELPQFLIASGFPERDADKILPSYLKKERVLTEDKSVEPMIRLVADGDWLEAGEYRFQCIHTPGHTEGHMCLYEPNRKMLISGDHIIGSGGPAVSYRYAGGNPLERYLASLDHIERLDVRLVLPGHRKVFAACRERIAQLKKLIEIRNQEIMAALQDGEKNAYLTASQLTWNGQKGSFHSLSLYDKLLATQKTCAHLTYLEKSRKLMKKKKEDEWVYDLA